MVFQMIGRALKALFKKPLRVFGLSMFVTLLMYLGCVLFFGIPAAGLVIGILMYTSLNWMYLRVLRGETGIAAKDMLDVFKDKETFVRVLKGMAWKYLWIFIWGLIPIAGFVFALIKVYEYRLVPYILLPSDPGKPSKDDQVYFSGGKKNSGELEVALPAPQLSQFIAYLRPETVIFLGDESHINPVYRLAVPEDVRKVEFSDSEWKVNTVRLDEFFRRTLKTNVSDHYLDYLQDQGKRNAE